MGQNSPDKPYGIKVRLPQGDSMSMSHLLGEDWESVRWYHTRESRDRIFEQMCMTPRNYRIGDEASIILDKIDP